MPVSLLSAVLVLAYFDVALNVMVLGGLNEGGWPAETDPGPWLSRPMMESLGLPSPERGIGLAACDRKPKRLQRAEMAVKALGDEIEALHAHGIDRIFSPDDGREIFEFFPSDATGAVPPGWAVATSMRRRSRRRRRCWPSPAGSDRACRGRDRGPRPRRRPRVR